MRKLWVTCISILALLSSAGAVAADVPALVAAISPSVVRVLVVIQNSPAHLAIEGGRVLPAPGEEKAWLREQKEAE